MVLLFPTVDIILIIDCCIVVFVYTKRREYGSHMGSA